MIIGILGCWTNRPEWMAHGDFADWLPPFLRKADPTLSFRTHRAHLGDLPEDPTACDAWLITVSAASVVDEPPWQAPLAAFLRSASGVRPIVGVCYGHQLLHHIYGGKVERGEGWGVGVHRYRTDAAFGGATEIRLLASHQDQVTEAAPDARVLAGSDFCRIAATRIGEDAVTIQPHPELTVDLAREVFSACRAAQGDATTDAALASLTTPIDDAAVAVWMLEFIRGFAAGRREVA